MISAAIRHRLQGQSDTDQVLLSTNSCLELGAGTVTTIAIVVLYNQGIIFIGHCIMPAIITDLIVYPIKSCAGISQKKVLLTETGFEHDRQWCVVDEATGDFLTQRSLPRMALIQPRLGLDALHIKAPGMLELNVPYGSEGEHCEVSIWHDKVKAYDQGDLAAQWFSDFLGHYVRLVRFDTQQRRLSSPQWTGEHEALNAFSDGYPILVVGEASLADLNQRLLAKGQTALPMNRFRPNLVVDGLDAFEEDFIDIFASTNGVLLKGVKPCPRCPIPTINQETAEQGVEPTDTLATYRANAKVGGSVTFGNNLIILAGVGQTLALGGALDCEIAFE
ncbi:MOSC domain-containing protein [Ampullimonas aquatilis]|uniref:MOSC domain-containing protein n=1 Tax=Ampullimonas aquatilis TaxID=1341549 RepID=UPI003C71DBAC